MYVSVDCEGTPGDPSIGEPGNRHLASVSYGREDGTCASKSGVTEVEMLQWIVDELGGHYTDANGREFIQVPVAFHFGWDSGMFAKQFIQADRDELGVTRGYLTPGMSLVRKVQTEPTTLLCDTNHESLEDCEKWQERHRHVVAGTYENQSDIPQLLHRRDPNDIVAVIAEGGEGDVIAWHEPSKLAFSITPGRRFYLERRPQGDRFEEWKRVDIHDNGSSFVGGLLKVIDEWKPELTAEQQAAIEWGKRARSEGFLGGTIEDVERYSEAECVAHARCSRLLVDTIRDAAHVLIDPQEHFGSGSIAGATLKRFRTPTRRGSRRERCPGTTIMPPEFTVGGDPLEDVALLTYFGGMIETPVVGLVKGAVDQLDINSAYPSKMIHLPCMRVGCGHWETRDEDWLTETEIPGQGTVGHVQVSWSIDNTSTPPFQVRRKDGTVCQPTTGSRVWVSFPEFTSARKRFGFNVIAHHAAYWVQECDHGNPLEFLAQMYARRLQLKRDMKDTVKGTSEWQQLNCRQNAIKLVINSIYGKLAQQRPTMGKYTNMHWASYITGATRAQVREETWLREDQGGTPVYQHTDSVLSFGGQPVDGGKELGAWGMEDPAVDFAIMQPGLAVALGGGKTATRGVSRDKFTDAVRDLAENGDLTQHPTQWPLLQIEDERMVTLHLALHRGKPEQAGLFLDYPIKISACSGKRDLERAVQMPGMPTAWMVPPWEYVYDVATVQDISEYRTMMIKRALRGEIGRHSDGA